MCLHIGFALKHINVGSDACNKCALKGAIVYIDTMNEARFMEIIRSDM